jgi:hypothetical protein
LSAGASSVPESAAPIVSIAGGKTFVLQRGVWTDTTFDPSQMTTVKVGFGTEPYFDLLTARPHWGDFLSLGPRVIFVVEGTAYEVVEGSGGPVEIPAEQTPEVTPSNGSPATAEGPTQSPAPSPTDTPKAPIGPTDGPSAPDRGMCASAPALIGLSLVGAVTVLVRRRR